MNLTETAKLLTVASTIDNRTVAEETVVAWHKVVGHLDYGTAQEAVLRHFGESTEYLLPRHVKVQASRIRDERERAERVARPAIGPQQITLDRAEFDRITQEAIAEARAGRDGS